MTNKGLFLKVPSQEGEGKKKEVRKTPFHFFRVEKKQQWEKESKWGNSRSKKQLVEAVLTLWVKQCSQAGRI